MLLAGRGVGGGYRVYMQMLVGRCCTGRGGGLTDTLCISQCAGHLLFEHENISWFHHVNACCVCRHMCMSRKRECGLWMLRSLTALTATPLPWRLYNASIDRGSRRASRSLTRPAPCGISTMRPYESELALVRAKRMALERNSASPAHELAKVCCLYLQLAMHEPTARLSSKASLASLASCEHTCMHDCLQLKEQAAALERNAQMRRDAHGLRMQSARSTEAAASRGKVGGPCAHMGHAAGGNMVAA